MRPLAYSLDVLLPLIDLHQRQRWAPLLKADRPADPAALVQALTWFEALCSPSTIAGRGWPFRDTCGSYAALSLLRFKSLNKSSGRDYISSCAMRFPTYLTTATFSQGKAFASRRFATPPILPSFRF